MQKVVSIGLVARQRTVRYGLLWWLVCSCGTAGLLPATLCSVPLWFPLGVSSAEAQASLDEATLSNVDTRVTIAMFGLRFDRCTNTYVSFLTVTNTSNTPLPTPLYLVLTSVTPASVTVVNATGQTLQNHVYYDLSSLVPGPTLDPQSTTSRLTLEFQNPANGAVQTMASILGPAPNRPPVLASIGDRTMPEGDSLQFTVTASDPDGNQVTLSTSALPANASFNPATGVFLFQPNFTQAGVVEVMFTATDNGAPPLSASASVRITVVDVPPPQVVLITPADGLLTRLPAQTVTGTVSDLGVTTATLQRNGTAQAIPVSNGAFSTTFTLAEGLNTISVSASNAAGMGTSADVHVTLDTLPPQLTITTPVENAELFEPQVRVAGTLDDQTAQVQVNGQAAAVSNGQWEVAQVPLQVGANTITIMATDAAGNGTQQVRHVTRKAIVLQAITVSPTAARLTTGGTQQPFTVTGQLSNGTTQDLTAASSGTTYASSNPFVASVNTDGVVTAVANGTTSLTIQHTPFTATAQVTVEVGVTLTSLDLSPATSTLRTAGATQQLSLSGTFSDGSTRDLTAGTTGTTYTSSDPGVATVSADGLVTAGANGTSTLTAVNEQLSANAQVSVVISSGTGFLRGEVYDDTTGLPLAHALVTLLADGSGPLALPVTTLAEARGQFLLEGLTGEALVRIEKPGFSSVERQGTIPQNTAFTLLDARLTPLDTQATPITSAIGGQARDAAHTLTLVFAPGSLETDGDIRVTALSNQGLPGRLPLGWSPIAAVDVQPVGLHFGQPVELQVLNTVHLPPGSAVTAAQYDTQAHRWVVQAAAQVTTDGTQIVCLLSTTGQVVLLVPDTAPFTPAAPQVGQVLPGVTPVALPADFTPTGIVVPRSAPPGEGARAIGQIVLHAATPLPSGTAVQVHVSERFDLLDASSVVPLPFTQDLLLYAQPRSGDTPSLSSSFPITPSIVLTLQELQLGTVRLDVTAPQSNVSGSVIGTTGGTVTDPAENAVEIPPGVLTTATVVDLQPLSASQIPLALPSDLALLGAVQLDLAGATVSQAVPLSIARPAPLPDGAQVLIARVITDPAGIQHLRLVALGQVQATRVVSRTIMNGLTLPGVTEGGQYVFVRPSTLLGLLTGTVFAPDGHTPQAQALVTTDTAPFTDLTTASGLYISAALTGTNTQVTAIDMATHNTASRTVHLTSQNDVLTLDLALGILAPTVLSTLPAAGAERVALDSLIVAQFSAPMDAATVTASSVVLQQNGTAVNGQRTLSLDGRSLTFRPDAALQGKTVYTLVLTDALRDRGGHMLVPFTGSFTTLDPSKPPQPPAGQITAQSSDADGIVMVIGTQGTAGPASAVTATNLRTQEATTVLAGSDGAFRLRLPAQLGDELALTFGNAASQQVTVAITQFENPDGSTALGLKGGTVTDADGRIARIVPHALSAPAVLQLETLTDATTLPALPTTLNYIELFVLKITGGPFNRLQSMTLTESQNRFAPVTATGAPFTTAGSFFVPQDVLVNSQLSFTATATDMSGRQNTLTDTTWVVSAQPSTATHVTAFATDFPTLFLSVPTETKPNGQVQVQAIAPTARIDFDLPAPAGLAADTPLLLARLTQLNGVAQLAIVDQFALTEVDEVPRMQTTGRALPGATAAGQYVVVASTQPLAFVTGRISGPATTVRLAGTPFVVETTEPNAAFRLPVMAGASFTLTFVNPATGDVQGTVTENAPASGEVDLGQPLSPVTGQLRVSAQPAANAPVDMNEALVLTFSEPIDSRTVPTSIIVTDLAGNRVFGQLTVSIDATQVTFTPSRRWRFGTTYRYGVAPSLLALSGTRLSGTFNGQFTTFTPRLLSSTSIDTVQDVAVSGNLALAGGNTGLSVLDIAQADNPVLLNQMAFTGGVAGVLLRSGMTLSPTNGQTFMGTLGLAASGNAATIGRLHIVDLNTPAAPVLLGSAQLTVPAGQNPPLHVPNAPGVPNAVVLGLNQQALVAVQSIGVETVNLAQAIPADPSNPGAALGPRYPATAFESANQVAVLGQNILMVGSNGLTILDGTSLARLGSLSTTGNAPGVAALAAFRMDVNGDGSIDPATEVFDLAVVANGQDGTLQCFNITNPAAPTLISVVRLGCSTNSVLLEPVENLAYVGCGVNGVMLVDLAGPASLQPIDLDRDGRDDRLLGLVDTPGSAGRLALNLARGVGYVADGASGLTAVQLIPPRTEFEAVLRDPVAAAQGDEQSILDTHQAFVTDDALQVTVHAVIPPQSGLVLAIQEVPEAGGAPLLAFPDGTTSAPLVNGVKTLSITIRKDQPAMGSQASLTVQDLEGHVIRRFDLHLTPADPGTATLLSLFLAPPVLIIPVDGQTAQLSVGGVFSDGRILNLSASASGTTYVMENSDVATINSEGLVTAVSGGSTNVLVANQTLTVLGQVNVERPATLTALLVSTPFVTLTALGAQQALIVTGRFSDGTSQDITQGFGTQYSSSAPGVVTVSANGMLTAISTGTATVTVTNGPFQAPVQVAVAFRTPPDITGIDLAPFAAPLTTDQSDVLARATVHGTGSLEGLIVTFSVSGISASQFTGITDYAGVALATLTGLVTPGSGTVTAAIINPASGATLSDSKSLTVQAGSSDNEPNNDVASASTLTFGKTINGTISAATDPQDIFRLRTTTAGTLTITLTLPAGTNPSDVKIIVLSGNATPLAQYTPPAQSSTFTQNIDAEQSFVAVETTGDLTAYTLTTSFTQAPVVITSVSPISGGPNTLVTITGSGFSTDPAGNIVLFATIAGKVVSATATQLQVMVPANAVNGPMLVMVDSAQAQGPQFITGNTGPLPPITLTPIDPAMIRFDPVTGTLLVVNRLLLVFDPVVPRSEVDDLASSVGGTVAGFLPTFNTYVFVFPTITTIPELEALARQIETRPSIRFTGRSTLLETAVSTFDLINFSFSQPSWPGTSAPIIGAYALANIPVALQRIRSTPPFDSALAFHPVTVAVLDTGFDPFFNKEFPTLLGTGGIQVIDATVPVRDAQTGYLAAGPRVDLDGHGTEVTSIIATENNNLGFSGILSSLYLPTETPLVQFLVYKVLDTPQSHIVSDTRKVNTEAVFAALVDIGRRTTKPLESTDPVDVVNASFGGQEPNNNRKIYHDLLSVLRMRTLVTAAAGNAGVDAQFTVPAVLATELANVMSIGAVAVADLDGTGEKADARAVFGKTSSKVPDNFPGLLCHQPVVSEESNCGPTVTLAAPGEDVLVATAKNSQNPGYGGKGVGGTSLAAPMVAGTAAILQAIRPQDEPFTPRKLREILVNTADDISHTWKSNTVLQDPIRRLNALAAVLAVLSPASNQLIYVADEDAVNDLKQPRGKLIAIEVDPLSGNRTKPLDQQPDKEIPLTFVQNGTTLQLTRPTAVEVSPVGDEVYVVVKSVEPNHSDGVLVIDTQSVQVKNFLSLSGLTPDPPEPLNIPTLKPGLVFSKDGRLLYVATGTPGQPITLINTVEGKIVAALHDLPSPYRTLASGQPLDTLRQRIQQLGQTVLQTGAILNPSGQAVTFISSLALSPDGKTLYAGIETGSGGGQQPGAVIALDVDLYKDADPNQAGLQSDLSTYLTIKPFVMQINANGQVVGDEPKAVAVSPDGKHVYLVTGGLDHFSTIVDTGNGSSATFLVAPGYTGVFNIVGQQEWQFLSTVGFGWNASGGAISQLKFSEVYTHRPFSMAIRPDGKRALVPYYQTGNFGVLDLDTQVLFQKAPPSVPSPNPAFATLSEGFFQGVVAATTALKLDSSLSPARGVLKAKDAANAATLRVVPSPDGALLSSWALVYAQNGRFAAASHVGNGPLQSFNVLLPDFINDIPGARVPLQELGFTFQSNGSTVTGADPQDHPVIVNQQITFQRGGGAISIINDRAITQDFGLHAGNTTTASQGIARAYYASIPVCKTVAVDPVDQSPLTSCQEEVVTHLLDYSTPHSHNGRFSRPRGVAVQPFITFESPRFGDVISAATGIQIRWRDARIKSFMLQVSDLSEQDPLTGTAKIVGLVNTPLTPDEIQNRTLKREFFKLFSPSSSPTPLRTYRIEARILTEQEELSRTSIDVTFERSAPPSGSTVAYQNTESPFSNPPPQSPFNNPQVPVGTPGSPILLFSGDTQNGTLQIAPSQAFLTSVTVDGKTFTSKDGVTTDAPILLFDRPYTSFCIHIGPQADQVICPRVQSTNFTNFYGSTVKVGLMDTQGRLLREVRLTLLPARITGPEQLTVSMRVDRINNDACPNPGIFTFPLTINAKVTLKIDNQVVLNAQDVVTGNAIPRFENIPFAAGTPAVRLFPTSAGFPGTHTYVLEGTDIPGYPGETLRRQGTIVYEIKINATMPIGHTMIKGVDIADGHLTHTTQDIKIPGRGLSLDFTRTYSSAGNASNGPLGAGWTHSYNIRLIRNSCGRYVVIGGEGTGNAFTLDGNTFRPQIGYHSTLVRDPQAATRFDFFTKAHIRYHFEHEPAFAVLREDEPEVYTLRFIEEPNGNRITLDYLSGDGDPTTLDAVTDASGRSLVLTYQMIARAKRLVRLTGRTATGGDLLGLDITYEYDGPAGVGNLLGVTRKSPDLGANLNDTRVESYTYTTADPRDTHNLVSYTDPNGHMTTYGYYTASDTIPGLTPGFGGETYEIVKIVAQPEDVVTNFGYDFTHTTRIVTDPRPGVPPTTYTLNAYGATRQTDAPLGKTTITEWCTDAPSAACPDRNGNPAQDVLMVSQTDAEGRTTLYEYLERLGNLTRETLQFSGTRAPVTLPDGTTAVSQVSTSYTYEPTFSKMTSKTDAEGHIMVYLIDAAYPDKPSFCPAPTSGGGTGNLLGVQDAQGNVTCYAYYPNGDVLSVTDPRNFVKRYTRYDAYGNPEEITDPVGNITTNVFDERSRLLDSRDTFTHHMLAAYDGLDRKIQEEHRDDLGKQGTAQVVTTLYKPNGEQERMTDGLGQTTHYLYDALNRRMEKREENVLQADGSTVLLSTLYQYDQASNLLSETDPRGITKLYTYDALNRRTRTDVQGPFTPNKVIQATTYDLVNNKLTETDLHGHTTTYIYDGLYRVVETRLPFPNAVIHTAYDRMGNKVRITDANGQPMTQVYDSIYRLTQKTDADGNTVTFAYDRANNKLRETNLSSGLVTEYPDYDGLNRPRTMRQTGPGLPSTGYTTSYAYQDGANAVIVTNPRGFKTRTDKDGLDRVFQTVVDVDSLNLTTTYTYDGNGNVKTVQDPQGEDIDVTHTYDGLNRKIRSTYMSTPGDNGQAVTEEFVYDGNNSVIRHKDRRGIVFTSTYDNLDRVLTQKVAETISNGGDALTVMAYTYNDPLTKVSQRDANGNVTTTTSDGLHRPTVIDDPDPTGLLTYEYDGVNKRARIDKKGDRTEYAYDAINRLVDTREFDLNATLKTTLHVDYLDEQNQKKETDRRGIVTTSQYDAMQRLVQRQRSGLDMATQYGANEVLLETYEYNGTNHKTTFIDGQGNRTEYAYDGADRQITVKEGAGSPVEATTTTTYDRANNVLTSKDGRNHGGVFDWQYTYDARYRKSSATNGELETTTYAYDANNNLTGMTEPQGSAFATTYRYDELNKLIAVDDTPRQAGTTTAGVTRFFYDGNRNKIAQQDANDNLVTYGYDGLNRLTDTFEHTVAGSLSTQTVRGASPTNNPTGGNEATALHWHFGYDLNSNQNLIIDARGQRVEMTHDYLNRLETKAYTQHAEPDLDFQMQSITYTYDGNSNVETITEVKKLGGSEVTELTTHTYDPLDRPRTTTHWDHDDGVGKRIEYAYDIQGNRSRIVDPDGMTTLYTYDARNRLDTATTEAGLTRYTYWEDSLVKTIEYPNHTLSDHSDPSAYDRADRMSLITNRSNDPNDPDPAQHPFSRYAYTYDHNGNRLTQVETQHVLNGGTPETTIYTYDNQNRLQSVTYGTGAPARTLSYTYAPNGNRLTEQGTDPQTGQSVDRTYTYGAITGKAGGTFDHVNALTQIADNLHAPQTITYEYDHNLNQVARETAGVRTEFHFGIRDEILAADELGGAPIRFDYAHDGMRVKKISGGTGQETRYLYDEKSVLVEYDGATATLPTFHKYDYGYKLLSLTQVNPTGQNRDSQFYLTDGLMSTANLTDEAGGLMETYRYDAWGRVRDQVGTSDNPRQYTGHYTDNETSLHYFGARYYDDETGRFLSQDAYLGEANTPPSLHRYLYAYANPLRYVDLTGYQTTTPEEDQEKKAKKQEEKEIVRINKALSGSGHGIQLEDLTLEEKRILAIWIQGQSGSREFNKNIWSVNALENYICGELECDTRDWRQKTLDFFKDRLNKAAVVVEDKFENSTIMKVYREQRDFLAEDIIHRGVTEAISPRDRPREFRSEQEREVFGNPEKSIGRKFAEGSGEAAEMGTKAAIDQLATEGAGKAIGMVGNVGSSLLRKEGTALEKRAAASMGWRKIVQELQEEGILEEGRYFVSVHGTTQEAVEKMVATQGKSLSVTGGNFGGRFFTALDEATAREFAMRTVSKYSGKEGIVGIALPEKVFEWLRTNKLARIENIGDRKARQVIFERGAIKYLQDAGYFFNVTK